MRTPVRGMRVRVTTLARLSLLQSLDKAHLGRRVTLDALLRELARQALAVRVKRLRRRGIDPGPVLEQARADMERRGKRKAEPFRGVPGKGRQVFD